MTTRPHCATPLGTMMDLRPIAYLIGRMLIALAILMLAPAAVDWQAGDSNARDFLEAAIITGAFGAMLSITSHNALGLSLDARQAYLLTVAIWMVIPGFGALPFVFGAPGLTFTDAYFEAVSGITTTGASVIAGLDGLPAGMNLWRGMLNCMGGLGIAFVAMIFLPVMRVGGMQFFKTEGFDTFGKVLPRATDIAGQLVLVYLGLTLLCITVYAMIGMSALDAVVNGMATIATGGFSPSDMSFSKYQGAGEYAGALFMILGSLPYIRYVQLINGSATPLWRDAQVRGYLRIIAVAVASVTLWRWLTSDNAFEPVFRQSLFNLVSIQSSTGFFSGDFSAWGGFMLPVAVLVGIFGACTGSSAAGLGVFRVQIAFAALRQHIRSVTMPDRVDPVRYEGRKVDDDVMSSVMMFVTGFILILGLLSVAMTMVGTDIESAFFGVWTSIGNIGYGFGPLVQRTGTFVDYSDPAKWIMTFAMLMGRLGMLAFLVVLLPRFWQR
ncbi:MAG: TrkH family potassium uptake protein [Paracoccaceae bacterium]